MGRVMFQWRTGLKFHPSLRMRHHVGHPHRKLRRGDEPPDRLPGVPSALLMIATRYTHSPFEMGDERDLDAALALLKAFVTTPASPLALGVM